MLSYTTVILQYMYVHCTINKGDECQIIKIKWILMLMMLMMLMLVYEVEGFCPQGCQCDEHKVSCINTSMEVQWLNYKTIQSCLLAKFCWYSNFCSLQIDQRALTDSKIVNLIQTWKIESTNNQRNITFIICLENWNKWFIVFSKVNICLNIWI